jgi:hypothetical protein
VEEGRTLTFYWSSCRLLSRLCVASRRVVDICSSGFQRGVEADTSHLRSAGRSEYYALPGDKVSLNRHAWR